MLLIIIKRKNGDEGWIIHCSVCTNSENAKLWHLLCLECYYVMLSSLSHFQETAILWASLFENRFLKGSHTCIETRMEIRVVRLLPTLGTRSSQVRTTIYDVDCEPFPNILNFKYCNIKPDSLSFHLGSSVRKFKYGPWPVTYLLHGAESFLRS
jgi:hypothetical protein